LHEHAAAALGGNTWGFVRGGMGMVTGFMADAAREAGVEIRVGSPVERVLVEGGQARGVELSSGEEIGAATVVSNADPKRTLLGLVGSDALDPETASAIEAYRCDGASLKINLAVGELPQIAGTPKGMQDHHRALVQLTLPLAEMDADQADARNGVPATAPHVEFCVPSALDPSLAPEGKHVITLGFRSQPYRLADSNWDAERDRVADRLLAEVGEMIPNLESSIIAREVLTPLDLERTLALTGGHHLHGDMSPDQLGPLRPAPGLGGYATTIGGLYLCGAGTHPGGGVTGANGRNCATRVLRDRQRGFGRGRRDRLQ
jgi:phytoene dehydrogenase-like protein